MAILFDTALVLVGIIVYYFEYTPVPKKVSMKDLWKYGINDGIIGDSLIMVGILGIFEDLISPYSDSMNSFCGRFCLSPMWVFIYC